MPTPTNHHRARTLASLGAYIERARSFSGWSFADVDTRYLDPPAPWDYEALAHHHAQRARSIVDLGTGGGEVLARIISGIDGRIVATEEWHVNAPIAAARLGPLGAQVVRADSLRLPFASESFDLVLDRHEALTPADAARVIAPGGTIITQQCGPNDWPELGRFVEKVRFPDHFVSYQQGFADAGLTVIDARLHERRIAFATLGDLVYMMLVAPWSFPKFDPAADIDALLSIEGELATPDGIAVTEVRYLIIAHKPN